MDKDLTIFNQFEAELSELREHNEKLVFDYEDPKGNKEARSHVHKLRRSKTAVTAIHKEAKADALAYGRRLDAKKRELITEIESMIDVHMEPIKRIEDREKAAIAETKRIADIAACWDEAHEMNTAVEQNREEEKEAERKWHERLEQERIDREARIAEEAKAKAEFDAQQRIKAAKQQAESDKQAEINRIKVEQAKKEAAEKFREDVKRKADEKRKADVEHQRRINNEVLDDMNAINIDTEEGKRIISAIVNGCIRHLYVRY